MIATRKEPRARPAEGRQAAVEAVRRMTTWDLARLYQVAVEILEEVSPRARTFPTSTQHYIQRSTLRKLAKATRQRW